jgi:hypothetical protein
LLGVFFMIMRDAPRILLLLLALAIFQPGFGQTYFNQRYTLAPDYSATTTILATSDGYWVAGAGWDTRPPSFQPLLLQKLDLQGQSVGSVHRWQQPGVFLYPCSGNALLPLPDGGMMLIGSSSQPGLSNSGNLWRFNAQGDTLWMRTYPDLVGAVIPRGGCRLPDGGFALVGEYGVPNSSARNSVDFLLIRTDSLGVEQWRRTYHQDHYDKGFSVVPTSDGGFLLAGSAYAFATGGASRARGVLIKVDSLGQEQWRKTIGGLLRDLFLTISPLANGGWLVGGVRGDRVVNFGNTALCTVKLWWFDSAGTLVKSRAYGPSRANVDFVQLLALFDGSYLVSGQTSDTTNAPFVGGGYPEGFMLRVCADGDSVWYRTYKNLTGGFSHNYLRDVKQTADGGFVGAGFLFANAPDTGPTSAWVFKTDANGYLQPGGAAPGVVCPVVGLPEAAAPAGVGVEVWPNPSADGRFNVRILTPQPVSLVVFDAVGRVVWRSTATAGTEVVVDLSHQPAGVYSLQVQGPDGQTKTNRLIR